MCLAVIEEEEYEVDSDVETDGRKINSNRDPPGQKCSYIPPGETERETYRLTTFRNYPRDTPIDPRDFASNGFYYTGYKDRVKCFSCGQSTDTWVLTDDVASSRWHDDQCDLINGRDAGNVPILSFLKRRQSASNQRQSTSTANQSSSSNETSSQAVSSNFSSSPTQYQTTSNHSNTTINSTPYSSVNSTSSNSSSHSKITDLMDTNHTQMSSTVHKTSSSFTPRDRVSNSNLFPCLYPINPHMRSREARMQTFLDHSANWPAHRIRATPHDIVDAGMFYLGERDRVKCWYCNGGLQNWERDDQPWEEHAKWFPLCEFVLQQKGTQFVENIVSGHPRLRRPNLHNPSMSSHVRQIARIVNQSQTRFGGLQGGSNSSPMIVDPRQELMERNNQIEEEMKSSDLVNKVRVLGFDDNHIKESLKRKYERDNRKFENLQDLIEEVINVAEEDSTEHESLQVVSSSSEPTSQSSSLHEMKRLEESKRCRVCRKDDACMVFIPCGHLCCCVNCGNKVKKCPICKETIRERVRSYIS